MPINTIDSLRAVNKVRIPICSPAITTATIAAFRRFVVHRGCTSMHSSSKQLLRHGTSSVPVWGKLRLLLAVRTVSDIRL